MACRLCKCNILEYMYDDSMNECMNQPSNTIPQRISCTLALLAPPATSIYRWWFDIEVLQHGLDRIEKLGGRYADSVRGHGKAHYVNPPPCLGKTVPCSIQEVALALVPKGFDFRKTMLKIGFPCNLQNLNCHCCVTVSLSNLPKLLELVT